MSNAAPSPVSDTSESVRVEVTVHYPRGTTVPPVVVTVGGHPLAPRASEPPSTPSTFGGLGSRDHAEPPPFPLPADVAWQASPQARARYFPQAVDEGQHDIWKREIALVIWRFLAGPDVMVARGWCDLDGAAPQASQPLFPLHTDVVSAARRLGLGRLVHAALGFAAGDRGTAPTAAEAPAGGGFRLLGGATFLGVTVPRVEHGLDAAKIARGIVEQHNSACALSAVAYSERYDEALANWRGPGDYPGAKPAEIAGLYALGPEGVDPVDRPDLANCPPLLPLRLEFDAAATGAPEPRRTPATGAAIPVIAASEPAPSTAHVPATPATGAAIPAAPAVDLPPPSTPLSKD